MSTGRTFPTSVAAPVLLETLKITGRVRPLLVIHRFQALLCLLARKLWFSWIERVDGSRGVNEVSSGRIFLSYRREDTRHIAGRLFDRLAGRFGVGNVFMDVDSIEPGLDFGEAIKSAVGGCDVLLALIGSLWLGSADDQGRRRIDDPDDLVVLEVKTALERQVRVIPVLIDGAAAPHRHELPEVLAPLARRNGVRLDHETFSTDLTTLMTALDRALRNTGLTRDQTTAASQRAGTASAAPHPARPARPNAATETPLSPPEGLHRPSTGGIAGEPAPRRGPTAIPHALPVRAPAPNTGTDQPSPDEPTRSEPVTAAAGRRPSPSPTEQAPTGPGPAQNTDTARESPPLAMTANAATAHVEPARSSGTSARVAEEMAAEKPSNRYGAPKTATDTAIPRILPSTAETTSLRRVLRKLARSRRTWLILAGVVLAAALLTTTITVLVHSTAGNTITATIPVGQDPWSVALTPDGRHAYITNSGSGSVSVIDTASNTITTTIPVGQNPFGVALTPDGRHAYITNAGSGSVSVIDTAG